MAVNIMSANNGTIALFKDNDAVELYNAGNDKIFGTTANGANLTGTVAATSYTGDGKSYRCSINSS